MRNWHFNQIIKESIYYCMIWKSPVLHYIILEEIKEGVRNLPQFRSGLAIQAFGNCTRGTSKILMNNELIRQVMVARVSFQTQSTSNSPLASTPKKLLQGSELPKHVTLVSTLKMSFIFGTSCTAIKCPCRSLAVVHHNQNLLQISIINLA